MSKGDHDGPRSHQGHTPEGLAIDDAMLRNYLSDNLPSELLSTVEKALRQSAELRARLEEVRNNREDFQLHSLGAFWRRSRLTCPGREQLGSYLLDVLDPEHASYIKFHIDVVECPYCQANLTDLQQKTAAAAKDRRVRIFEGVQKRLAEDSRGG